MIRTLVLVVAMCGITAVSAAQISVGAHVGVGPAIIDAGFRSMDPVSLPRTAGPWDASGGLSIGGGIDVMMPLAGEAMVGVQVGMRMLRIEGTASEAATVLIDGQPTSATFDHAMTSDVTALTALLVLRYPIMSDLYLELGTGMATSISSTATQTERITSPPSLTYVEGGKERTVVDGGSGEASIGALVVPGLIWRPALTSSLSLEVGLSLVSHLGPMTSGSDLVAFVPAGRVGLAWRMSEAAPDDVMP